jgi:septal ring factor EnvC (AmiA/AmiB activator)
MRRARRSSLIALLLLTAQTGTGPGAGTGPAGSPPDQEASARRQVEDSERVRAIQLDAQRAATEQAAQALADEQRLTAAQSEAFERLKHAEAAVNEITRHMIDLNQRRAEAQKRIDQRRAALQAVMPIIIRMAMYPVETLLASRLPADDAITGYLVMRNIARQAQLDAKALEVDRQGLDDATKAAAAVAPQLAAAEAARSFEADVLARQLAETKERRAEAEHEASDASRRAAAEAARAKSLRSMLQTLETQRRLEEAKAREDELRAERDQKTSAADAARVREAALSRPAGTATLNANAKPAGQLTPPVIGILLRGWGDPENGEPATGQTWQTKPGARVLAPCGGTVAFAEPFQGYGLLVIIDCGGGYHAVLSGLDQIAVAPGQAIQSGDPVGAMKAATKSETAGGTPADQPILYIEIRKAGRPVDPSPWLKPSG